MSDRFAALEAALCALVQSAPACTPTQLEAARRLAVAVALDAAAAGDKDALGLACAIERVLILLPAGHVDPAAALPALAMAATTFAAADRRAVAAAWYEVDTLLPLPGAAPRHVVAHDVPIERLRRGPSPLEPAIEAADEPGATAEWSDEAHALLRAARLRARRGA